MPNQPTLRELLETMQKIVAGFEDFVERTDADAAAIAGMTERLKAVEAKADKIHRVFYEGNGDSFAIRVNVMAKRLDAIDAKMVEMVAYARANEAEKTRGRVAFGVAIISLIGVIIVALVSYLKP